MRGCPRSPKRTSSTSVIDTSNCGSSLTKLLRLASRSPAHCKAGAREGIRLKRTALSFLRSPDGGLVGPVELHSNGNSPGHHSSFLAQAQSWPDLLAT